MFKLNQFLFSIFFLLTWCAVVLWGMPELSLPPSLKTGNISFIVKGGHAVPNPTYNPGPNESAIHKNYWKGSGDWNGYPGYYFDPNYYYNTGWIPSFSPLNDPQQIPQNEESSADKPRIRSPNRTFRKVSTQPPDSMVAKRVAIT